MRLSREETSASGRDYDVIVIGGGAAGLMCAIEAGRRGRRVAVIEHQNCIGKKIVISGGGRCNFTNLDTRPDRYLSARPDFCKSALARYTPADFIALVEKHGIAYHEKKLGQQFCDRSSRSIVQLLLDECAAADAKILLSCDVTNATKGERFALESNRGTLGCDSLVIATGGLSFPKLGASDFGYRLARQFGLKVTELRPGLVPLTCASEDLQWLQSLSGVSLPVSVRRNGREFREAMLFTHRGVSGPAILQISSYWREGDALQLNLLPETRADDLLAEARREKTDLASLLSRHWPRRFAEAWSARHAPSKLLAHYKDRELSEIARLLHAWPLIPAGTEGYAKAEVTLGGVDTAELSSKTMETRKVPGLYFIGEVVDVTGWLGGYNFQWAWASGFAAGQVV